MKTLRFGVIGCGGIASSVHVPNMAAIKGAATVAYGDLDLAKAQALLHKYGGEYATDDAQRLMEDQSLDGVLIQTGPAAHPQLVQAAARAGKHVFVEKPLALHLRDALETVRVVQASGVKFMFGACNRLAAMVKLAKRMCPHPVYSFCQCSDTITHQACHNLDLEVGRAMMDDPPCWVMMFCRCWSPAE